MPPPTGTDNTVVDEPEPTLEGSRAARDSINRSRTPAFSCLSDGTVLNWNPAAERTFGVGADEARRGRCYEIVAGIDVFGNDYCSRHCPVREMACRGRPIRPFRMTVRGSGDRRRWVRAMILVLRDGDEQPELVHLLDPLERASPDPKARRL